MTGARAALIVANDHYTDLRLSRLVAPAEDARELDAVLKDPDIGGFDVHLSLNEPEHQLRRTLSRFFRDRGRGDLLLVHFSCHGVKDDDGRLFFATVDTDLDHLDVTAIAAELVDQLMDRSLCRRIVLMLDCCYGGAFSRGTRVRADSRVDLKERLNGTGRVVISASNAMEFAFEGDELHGAARPSVFTSAVVEGLATGGADLDGDQMISVDELYRYLFDSVRSRTPHQTPGRFGSIEGDLIIARTREARPAPLPADLIAAMASGSSDVREGAVRGLARLLNDPHPGLALSARRALAEMIEDDSRRVSSSAAYALKDAVPREIDSEAPESHPTAVPPTAQPASPPPAAQPVPDARPAAAHPTPQAPRARPVNRERENRSLPSARSRVVAAGEAVGAVAGLTLIGSLAGVYFGVGYTPGVEGEFSGFEAYSRPLVAVLVLAGLAAVAVPVLRPLEIAALSAERKATLMLVAGLVAMFLVVFPAIGGVPFESTAWMMEGSRITKSIARWVGLGGALFMILGGVAALIAARAASARSSMVVDRQQ